MAKQIPPHPPEFTGSIGRSYKDSTPAAMTDRLKAPRHTNVLLILLDDVGFGQPEPFGGPIAMPALRRLADEGLRYTRFHTTAMCSPTRAALLTGRNHHVAASGIPIELGTDFPGYTGSIPRDTACIAEILRSNGYSTSAFGKWHNTPLEELSPFGPFDRWPTGMGFEYFYGFFGAEHDQWNPTLVENTRYVDVPHPDEPEGYHLDTDLSEKAQAWLRGQRSAAPDKPFFMYYAPGTAHAPHCAPSEFIDRYDGVFDDGWDELRKRTYQRQLEMGLTPEDTELTPRPSELPSWDSLSAEEQRICSRLMQTMAAAVEHCDYQINRLIDTLDEVGAAENTIVMYVAGDNGPSAEGGRLGLFNSRSNVNRLSESTDYLASHFEDFGTERSHTNYPAGWAWAGTSPLQWVKQIASHFGGTRNGMVVRYPQAHTEQGTQRTQFLHCIDVVPTILDIVDVEAPESVNGIKQKPIQGTSFASTLSDAAAPEVRKSQYFEISGNRSIFHDGWMASAWHGQVPWIFYDVASGDFDADNWELYNVDADFSQARDLSEEHPEILRKLKELWEQEAVANQVLPLDDRHGERLTANASIEEKTRYEFFGPIRVPEAHAPSVRGRSHRFTFQFERTCLPVSGTLVSAGGRFGGYALVVDDEEHLVYHYNYAARQTFKVRSREPIPQECESLSVGFAFSVDEAVAGSGGTVSLFVNDEEVGKGRVDVTMRSKFSFSETFNVGKDAGSPVADEWVRPNIFSGRVRSLVVDLATASMPAKRDVQGIDREDYSNSQ